MRFSWVGAENVDVTLCLVTSRTHSLASNLRMMTTVPPSMWERKAKAFGPEW